MNCLAFYELTEVTDANIIIIASVYKQCQHDALLFGQIEFV